MKSENFIFKGARESVDFRAKLTEYEHKPSGLRLVRALTDDPEYFFSFAFRTPPTDSSGVQHIIEHCVLGGSESYPSKDPFMEVVSSSSCSFINAMTYPSFTQYPAAGMVLHDLEGVFRMYADAVFRPRLERGVFLQEGVRRKLDGSGRIIGFDGVVFNEMSENVGTRADVGTNELRKMIYAGKACRFNSGGSPEEIPFLTYEKFKSYYSETYVPENCILFLYGRSEIDCFADYLEGKYLKGYAKSKGPKFPRESVTAFGEYGVKRAPFDSEDNSLPSFFLVFDTGVSVNDTLAYRSLSVLVHALLGDSRYPLYSKLVGSGIAGDVSDESGIEYEGGRVYLVIGLDDVNVAENAAEKCSEVILGAIGGIIAEGISDSLIVNSLKDVEISALDRTSREPLGIKLVEKAMRSREGLFDLVDFSEDVKRAGAMYEKDGQYFNRLLKQVTSVPQGRKGLLLYPSDDSAADRKRRMLKIIAELNSRATAADIAADDRAFSEFAARGDVVSGGKFAFAGYEELLKFVRHDNTVRYSFKEEKFEGEDCKYDYGDENGEGTFLFRKRDCNGLAYVRVAFDVSDFSADDVGRLMFAAEAVERADMDGGDEFFGKFYLFAHEFSCDVNIVKSIDGKTGLFFIVSFKSLERDMAQALRYLSEFLNGMAVTEKTVRDSVAAVKVEYDSDPAALALPFSNSLAGMRLSFSSALFSVLRGAQFKTRLDAMGDDGANALVVALPETIRGIFGRNRMVLSVTAGEPHCEEALEFMSSFSNCVRECRSADGLVLPEYKLSDGDVFVYPMTGSVSYSSLCFQSAPRDSAMDVFADFFQNTSFYQRVRVEGGSYGAIASYSFFSGIWTLSSYRDPLYKETFGNFRKSLETEVSESDLKKMKDSFFSSLARPDISERDSASSLANYLTGYANSVRQDRFDRAANVTLDDVRASVDRMKKDFMRNYKASSTPHSGGAR